jgi:small subunit ribosomal protein S8
MSMTDPISDMLTRIRNAHQALHRTTSMPLSKAKASIAEILKDEGYITDFAVAGQSIEIALKYDKGKPLISGMRRISKPGRRVYVGADEIPSVQNGLGICVLSTSQGLLAGSKAGEKNIGGELMFEVW